MLAVAAKEFQPRILDFVSRNFRLTKVARAKDKHGFDLISDALPFGRLWYGEPNAITKAIGYVKFYSRSH